MFFEKKYLIPFLVLGFLVIPGPIITVFFSDAASYKTTRIFQIISYSFLFIGVISLVLVGIRIQMNRNLKTIAAFNYLLFLLVIVLSCFLIRPFLWHLEYSSKIKKCTPLINSIKLYKNEKGFYPKNLSVFSNLNYPILTDKKLIYRVGNYNDTPYCSLVFRYEVDPFFMDKTKGLSKTLPSIEQLNVSQELKSDWKISYWY